MTAAEAVKTEIPDEDVLRAQLYRQNGTEVGDRDRMAIVVTGSLSRAAFGADGWSGMAGDRVDLTILARIRRGE